MPTTPEDRARETIDRQLAAVAILTSALEGGLDVLLWPGADSAEASDNV